VCTRFPATVRQGVLPFRGCRACGVVRLARVFCSRVVQIYWRVFTLSFYTEVVGFSFYFTVTQTTTRQRQTRIRPDTCRLPWSKPETTTTG